MKELLPSGDKLSLRGGEVLKHALALLPEFDLPLTYLNRVLESEPLRLKLLAQSKNPRAKLYFGRQQAIPLPTAPLRDRVAKHLRPFPARFLGHRVFSRACSHKFLVPISDSILR